MASKKTVGIIVVVVALIAFMVLAFSGDSEPDARYNYEFEVVDSFIGDDGETIKADKGEVFVILTLTIANDHYSSGITTNDLINRWSISNGTVTNDSYNFWTMDHPGYVGLVDINEGATLTYTMVYDMPDTTTADNVTVSHEWVSFTSGPDFILDESL